jgi:hypothetical protein
MQASWRRRLARRGDGIDGIDHLDRRLEQLDLPRRHAAGRRRLDGGLLADGGLR